MFLLEDVMQSVAATSLSTLLLYNTVNPRFLSYGFESVVTHLTIEGGVNVDHVHNYATQRN